MLSNITTAWARDVTDFLMLAAPGAAYSQVEAHGPGVDEGADSPSLLGQHVPPTLPSASTPPPAHTRDGKSTDRNTHFYVLRRDIRDLSPDEARENNNEATVVLAFPVDVAQTPIIEKQLTYAFLPLKELGFTVTGASLTVTI